MRKIALLIFLASLAFQTFAQERPKATMIDEFNNRKGDLQILAKKTDEFVSRLLRETAGTQGAYISYPRQQFYSQCNGDVLLPDRTVQNFVAKRLRENHQIKKNQVMFIQGNPFLNSIVEFWLIPKGGEKPRPQDREYNPGCCCAEIITLGEPTATGQNVLSFSAGLRSMDFAKTTRFKWTVSVGKIVGGQGTKSIRVKVGNIKADEVTATVDADFNPSCGCSTIASFTTKLIPR